MRAGGGGGRAAAADPWFAVGQIVQEPLGMHFLSKFYAEDGVGEEVAFLSTVEQLVEGKDVLDTCCELLQVASYACVLLAARARR